MEYTKRPGSCWNRPKHGRELHGATLPDERRPTCLLLRHLKLFRLSRSFSHFVSLPSSNQYLNNMVYDSVEPTLCWPNCCFVSTGSVVVTVV